MTWQRFCDYLTGVPSVGLTLDISRMSFTEQWLEEMEPRMQKAFSEMAELERGSVANRDEKRMVGHYWLRAPELAPLGLGAEIEATVSAVKKFAAGVHAARHYTGVLSIGIGGSALGPMFVADALGHPSTDKLRLWFLDNTDPDGIARVLSQIHGRLEQTLTVVISKSGGTPETRNGMILVQNAYRSCGLDFARHAVAVTMHGSALDKQAVAENWKARFEMFDWIGGRTSQTSAVGLVLAALQGLDIDALLEGARLTDAATRNPVTRQNPAAMMALMWHHATNGKGEKDMVVLPYKDRLLLFSRYLQQLIMESLGKQFDLDGNVVEQGIAVYGNKGSTDQHAYVQQLRDGVNNFFVVFIRVLEDGGSTLEVAPGIRAGDYLDGFYLGTRKALAEKARQSMTITVPRVDARSVGALIALFERAVGLYANLVNINAYHQPGVQAGKEAADEVLKWQVELLGALTREPQSPAELAPETPPEAAYLILEHLAANGRARKTGDSPSTAKFSLPD
jgi:glucose-6-phosphate isomerase